MVTLFQLFQTKVLLPEENEPHAPGTRSELRADTATQQSAPLLGYTVYRALRFSCPYPHTLVCSTSQARYQNYLNDCIVVM